MLAPPLPLHDPSPPLPPARPGTLPPRGRRRLLLRAAAPGAPLRCPNPLPAASPRPAEGHSAWVEGQSAAKDRGEAKASCSRTWLLRIAAATVALPSSARAALGGGPRRPASLEGTSPAARRGPESLGSAGAGCRRTVARAVPPLPVGLVAAPLPGSPSLPRATSGACCTPDCAGAPRGCGGSRGWRCSAAAWRRGSAVVWPDPKSTTSCCCCCCCCCWGWAAGHALALAASAGAAAGPAELEGRPPWEAASLALSAARLARSIACTSTVCVSQAAPSSRRQAFPLAPRPPAHLVVAEGAERALGAASRQEVDAVLRRLLLPHLRDGALRQAWSKAAVSSMPQTLPPIELVESPQLAGERTVAWRNGHWDPLLQLPRT